MAALAPMPRDTVKITAVAKPGDRIKEGTGTRRSCQNDIVLPPHPIGIGASRLPTTKPRIVNHLVRDDGNCAVRFRTPYRKFGHRGRCAPERCYRGGAALSVTRRW